MHRDAGRPMGQIDRRLRLVAMLTTGAGAAGRLPFEVLLAEDELLFARLGKHRDGDGARLHAPATLIRRNALPSMAAWLLFEHRLGYRSAHAERDEAHAPLEDV